MGSRTDTTPDARDEESPDLGAVTDIVANAVRDCIALLTAQVEEGHWAEDQRARFNIWAVNIGVFAHGHASLDYRLRDVPDILGLIMQQVAVLKGNLSYLLVSPQDQPATLLDDECKTFISSEDRPDTPNSSASSEPLSESESEEQPQYDAVTAVEEAITKLYKLSSAIRKSGNQYRDLRAENHRERGEPLDDGTFDDLTARFEEFTMKVIPYRVPRRDAVDGTNSEPIAQQWLQERLAKSIARRRNRFCYWRKHQKKLERSSWISPDSHTKERGGPTPSAPVFSSPKQDKNPGPVRTEDTRHTPIDKTIFPKLLQSRRGSNATSASFIWSNTNEIPGPPDFDQNATHFTCPLCFIVCKVEEAKRKYWIQHITRDLKPFICVFEYCKTPEALFGSFREWISHMVQEQLVPEWHCASAIHEEMRTFNSQGEFEAHLKREHKSPLSDSELPKLSQRSKRHAFRLFQECPLCDFECTNSEASVYEVQDILQRHVSDHLQSLALLSLPTLPDDGFAYESGEEKSGEAHESSRCISLGVVSLGSFNSQKASSSTDSHEFADAKGKDPFPRDTKTLMEHQDGVGENPKAAGESSGFRDDGQEVPYEPYIDSNTGLERPKDQRKTSNTGRKEKREPKRKGKWEPRGKEKAFQQPEYGSRIETVKTSGNLYLEESQYASVVSKREALESDQNKPQQSEWSNWSEWEWIEEYRCRRRYRLDYMSKNYEYEYEQGESRAQDSLPNVSSNLNYQDQGVFKAEQQYEINKPKTVNSGHTVASNRKVPTKSDSAGISLGLSQMGIGKDSGPRREAPPGLVTHICTKNPQTIREEFDPHYKVHHAGEFTWGRVFKIVWSEPKGDGDLDGGLSDFETREMAGSTTHFAKVVRFLIVEVAAGHCICLKINTYSGQGVTKAGIRPDHHAVIHTTPNPIYLSGELEKGLSAKPVKMNPDSPRHDLDKASRLNYAKLYSVEYNVKVWFIGRIHQGSMHHVAADYDRVHPPLASPGSARPKFGKPDSGYLLGRSGNTPRATSGSQYTTISSAGPSPDYRSSGAAYGQTDPSASSRPQYPDYNSSDYPYEQTDPEYFSGIRHSGHKSSGDPYGQLAPRTSSGIHYTGDNLKDSLSGQPGTTASASSQYPDYSTSDFPYGPPRPEASSRSHSTNYDTAGPAYTQPGYTSSEYASYYADDETYTPAYSYEEYRPQSDSRDTYEGHSKGSGEEKPRRRDC